ncbi:MAG: hypothetical protein A2Y07_03275 [Planctomycetes bacterium GWF2_50_10]|nr:MAG: hypothetical protein A2Y07_03275 [Planctomycetes bacterium GWF2_50_10]
MANKTILKTITVLVILLSSGIVLFKKLPKWAAPVHNCEYKLGQLGLYFMMLSENSKAIDANWCDQIVVDFFGGTYSDEVCSLFSCIEYVGEKRQSTYALNRNVVGQKQFDDDIVILFDSKKGWNSVGGPELLAPENNKGEGCYVLFGDFKTKFIKTSELSKLKWQ